MLPDYDLQLRVVIKALEEVVAPAVDPENQLAVEQLRLSLATLGMVRDRVPFVEKCARKELGHALALAAQLRDEAPENEADSLGPLIDEAHEALGSVNGDAQGLDRIRKALLSAVSSAIDTADPARVLQISKAGIAQTKPQIELQRAWCAPSGFEPDISTIASLEDLLDN